jgi:hypothetical protein
MNRTIAHPTDTVIALIGMDRLGHRASKFDNNPYRKRSYYYVIIDGHLTLTRWVSPGMARKSTVQARPGPVSIVPVTGSLSRPVVRARARHGYIFYFKNNSLHILSIRIQHITQKNCSYIG